MNMYIKILLLLCLTAFTTDGFRLDDDLDDVVDKINKVKNRVEDAIDNEEIDDIKEILKLDFRDSRKGINALLRGLKEEQVIKDILAIEVIEMELKLDEVLLYKDYERDDFLMSPDETVASYRKNIGRLLRIKKRLKSERKFMEQLQDMRDRKLRKIGIARASIQLKHGEFKEQVNSMINASEAVLYELLVPNRTVKQLNKYIDLLTFNDDELSAYTKKAFLKLYELLCSDGEIVTLEAFEAKQTENKNSINNLLFNETAFRSRYEKDRRIAVEKGGIAHKDKIYSEDKYAALLKLDSLRTELDIIILKKIIATDLFNQNYVKVLDKLQQYRERFKDYQNLLGQIDELIALVEQKQEGQSSLNFKKLPLCSNKKNELNYVYNNSFDKLSVLPLVTKSLVKYRKEAGVFVKFSSTIHEERYYYWYEDGSLEKRDKVSAFKLERLKPYQFCKDFYISPDYRIALFVSDSRKLREEVIKSEYSTEYVDEYNSKGLIPQSLSLQEYKKPKGFRGKTYGNTNSDIYYCLFDSQTKQWSDPKILKGVNSPYSERSPYISEDNSTLYFSSEGYNGLGGFDVYSIPISVDYGRKEITVSTSTSVTNEVLINSVNDDLFYREIQEEQYVSSNRDRLDDKDFDIYKVAGEESVEARLPLPPPSKSQGGFIKITDDISFEYNCDSLPHAMDVGDDKIIVTGRIYGKNGQLFPRSKIIFTSKQGASYVDSVNIIETRDSNYSLIIPHKKAFFVKVFGYNNDYSIKAFSQSFVFTCENVNNKFIVKKDFELDPLDVVMDDRVVVKEPFLFETNSSNINALIDLDFITNIYAEFSDEFKNENTYFLLRGFADNRGLEGSNCLLSQRRALAVKSFLVSLGFASNRIKVIPKGETIDFKEDLDQYSQFFYRPGYINTEREIELQLNRRVEVVFCNGQNCNEKSCMDY